MHRTEYKNNLITLSVDALDILDDPDDPDEFKLNQINQNIIKHQSEQLSQNTT